MLQEDAMKQRRGENDKLVSQIQKFLKTNNIILPQKTLQHLKLREFLAKGLVTVISHKAMNLKKKVYIKETNSLLSSLDPNFLIKNVVSQ